MPEPNINRNEGDIFNELEILCQSPGYIHAIAHICMRDNTISYSSEIKLDDILKQYSNDRLVRTEISTLIGLLCKKDIDDTLPLQKVIEEYIFRTDSLLKELHQSMMPSPKEILNPAITDDTKINPFNSGAVIRESIFYSGESAYQFQYRDLSEYKYKKDNEWLTNNKGYTIEQAISVISSIQSFQDKNINNFNSSLNDKDSNELSIIDNFTFSLEDITNNSKLDAEIVSNVIRSFVSPAGNNEFASLDDFNSTNAYPIIQLKGSKYLLFQSYSLVEALYETPFYWFNSDEEYRNTAMQHRGEFTENFSSFRLKRVFGEKRVFDNVLIKDVKGNTVGEIDVLVVFANRAIVLQAKSKKLTLASRKGNDLSLKDDFKKAVQDSYNQAFLCSTYLSDSSYDLVDNEGNLLALNREFKEIYPFCVVSDHYPSLSFQARQFLQQNDNNVIKPAFVMDVFFLDVITEMLASPLHFLSYINKRAQYNEKIFSTHELTILSYHLKQNLWLDSAYDMMHLGDDICADLDLVMLARRDGIPSSTTMEGILTKYEGTHFDLLVKDIEMREHAATIDLGIVLLTLSGETIEVINNGISKLLEISLQDGNHHDFSLGTEGGGGITFHCNDYPDTKAAIMLNEHCELRKYDQKTDQWFGVCISAKSQEIRFGINKIFKWERSDEMDVRTRNLGKPQSLKEGYIFDFKNLKGKNNKVGRNEKCPCGSGKKYKKCCLA